jgi:predicted GNAT family N-acyltransferase
MRVSHSGFDARAADDSPALSLQFLVSDTYARGAGAAMIELAVNESVKITGGQPCVVLSAGSTGLWDLYRDKYGFVGVNQSFNDASVEGNKMELRPDRSDKWQRTAAGQYELKAKGLPQWVHPQT